MMATNELLDLRVRRTYKFLWKALIELLMERNFEEISVTEICDRAMVHRTTFYKHYEDKYGLLAHGIQDELKSLFTSIDWVLNSVQTDGHKDALAYYTALFEHIHSNISFYSVMLCGKELGQFTDVLQRALTERLKLRLQSKSSTLEMPEDLHATVQGAAIVATITWWLKHNCPYTPTEMTEYLRTHLDLARTGHP